MSHILTLIASDPEKPLASSHIEQAQTLSGTTNSADWLEEDQAAALTLPAKPERPILEQIRETLKLDKIDLFSTPAENRIKKLVIADMDSTIVKGETLDDLAAFAGIKDQIATITARAMNGELDFHAAIRERVGLLKGLSATALQETLDALEINPRAENFIRTMAKNGATCVLVSGGFTVFTQAVADKLGFDAHHGNQLGIDDGKLNGTVIDPILDKNAKVEFLSSYMEKHALTPADCLTIGDGANDLPMLKTAQDGDGLGIGYKAKETVAKELDNLIIHGTFDAALYAQGLKKSAFELP